MQNDIRRGEIYYLTDNNNYTGSEQRSGRPVVVVSNDLNNQNSKVIEVVSLTTREKKELPTHVTINSSRYASTVLCEQIKSVSVDRLGDFMGIVTDKEMEEINEALLISLGLDEYVERLLNENETEDDASIEQEIEREEADQKITNDNEKLLLKVTAERDTYKEMYEQLLKQVVGR